jgi:hypothetical protein
VLMDLFIVPGLEIRCVDYAQVSKVTKFVPVDL